MEVNLSGYKLRCEISGHKDHVRAICVCEGFGIATSSRDGCVRFWAEDPMDKRRFTCTKILSDHIGYVGPISWIHPDEKFAEGRLISGGMDMRVLVWDLSNNELLETLIDGHRMHITGLMVEDGLDIVSSSVDGTLTRWRNGKIIDSWEAHNSAVQSIIKLNSREFVSGASDGTLKLWKGKSCLATFDAHTGPVRCLAIAPNQEILSASNDMSIKKHDKSGTTIMDMKGHTSFIYSVHSHSSGIVVSGSEDCSAKIWEDGRCVQTIDHPGCVWDVKFLENGDIVTACSDGVVRLWTKHQINVAEPQELESYSTRLAQYKHSRKTFEGLSLNELPTMEALQIPGTIDGQTKIVRKGDNGVTYAWNAKDQIWYPIPAEETLPIRVDWRDHGAVTPVGNQLRCACCYAFAVCTCIECIRKIKTGKLEQLSPQQIVDCFRRTCKKGSKPFRAFEYVKENGLHTLKDYPYTGVLGKCKMSSLPVPEVKISGYECVIPDDEIALQKAVARQPVAASIWYDEPFRTYQSNEIITTDYRPETHTGCQVHSVVIVGYDETIDGTPYWIIKNSWSTKWGANGYYRMLRNTDYKSGLRGIARRPVYPLL